MTSLGANLHARLFDFSIKGQRSSQLLTRCNRVKTCSSSLTLLESVMSSVVQNINLHDVEQDRLEEHSSHDWESITDILREKRYILPQKCKDIRENQLPDLRKEIDRFDQKIQDEDSRLELTKSNLNGSRQRYINGINRLFDNKINECQQKSNAAKEVYVEKREGLKKKVEYLDMMTKALHNDINKLPDHDILDMEKDMRDELKKALSDSADKYTSTTMFVPGQMDEQALENMIGEIHSMSVEETGGSVACSGSIASVKPVSETNAWIRVRGSRVFELIDRKGEKVNEIRKPGTDLVISRNGDIVLTDNRKNKVSVFTKDENQKATFQTKLLYPTNISKTENDDILVTLMDGGDHYNLVPTSRRVVQRMTLTGKVLQTYEFREDGKTRLFTCPGRTAENKNMDVCIINALNSKSWELVVLHEDGHLKFTYRGDGQPVKFITFDVECDDKCHILLTEGHSKRIHILSSEGKYLFWVCQYEDLIPIEISMYGDYLWCGLSEGRVKVYRYTN
ncbi:hypothetical protein FSP39_009592 [Pinctada imbricata]|uniref:Tripartite motif-containing protein 2 n=1 Tax=Pinctada imbricata TaxID=66713 RepID=A0AA88YI98_PINIB|nr:hypothetical protein FSP39_009592 [Pinctada imbricata]